MVNFTGAFSSNRFGFRRSSISWSIIAMAILGFCTNPGNADDAAEGKAKKLSPIKPEAVSLKEPLDFEQHVYPILEANCIACHNLAISEGKLNLEDVPAMLKGGKHGAAVVPKKPEESLLYQLASRAKQPVMPPLPNDVDAHALTGKEVGILRQWILDGAAAGTGSGPQAVEWRPLPKDVQSIFAVDLGPAARFAVVGRANQLRVYDVQTKQDLGPLHDPQLRSLTFDGQPMYPQGAAHRDFVHSVAFSPDGRLIASGGYRNVKLWTRQPHESAPFGGSVKAASLSVSADGGQILVGGSDGVVTLLDSAGQAKRVWKGHVGAVAAVGFLPKTGHAVSAGVDKTVRIWKLDADQALHQWTTPAEVHSLAVSGNEQLIATAHQDNVIRVWSAVPPKVDAQSDPKAAEEMKPVRELKGHTGPVRALATLLPGGTQLVSGADDKTVRIWDLNNGRQIRSMSHSGPVTDVAVRPDGKMIAASSSAKSIRLWNPANGKQEAEVRDDFAAEQFTQQRQTDKTVADARQKLAESAVKTAEKNVTDREGGLKSANEAATKAKAAQKEPAKKLADAKSKLDAAKKALSAKKDDKNLQKKVADAQKVFDQAESAVKKADDDLKAAERSIALAEKSIARAKEILAEKQQRLEQAKAAVTAATKALTEAQKAQTAAQQPQKSLSFSADSKQLVSISATGRVQLWSADSGRALDSISTAFSQAIVGRMTKGDHLVIADGTNGLQTISLRPQWKLSRVLGGDAGNPLDVTASPLQGRALAVAFSPDSQLLAVGSGDPSRSGQIVLWQTSDGKLLRQLDEAHSDTVLGLEFSRQGDQLVSSGSDKFVKIFNVADGSFVRSFEGHTHHVMDVTWRADGSRLASAGADNVVKVWNVETGEQITTVTGYGKQVTSVQYIGTGDNIVSSGGDKAVRLHTASNRRQYRTLGGATDYVYAVDASADETLVIAGGAAGVLRVWNGKTGQVLATFEPPQDSPADNLNAAK